MEIPEGKGHEMPTERMGREMLSARDSMELGRLIQMIVSDPHMRDLVRADPAKALAHSKIELSAEASNAFIEYAQLAAKISEGVGPVQGAFFFFVFFFFATDPISPRTTVQGGLSPQQNQ
jgi:VIT1/CCC1 family predicted Fe2+/Mn2+ transporter